MQNGPPSTPSSPTAVVAETQRDVFNNTNDDDSDGTTASRDSFWGATPPSAASKKRKMPGPPAYDGNDMSSKGQPPPSPSYSNWGTPENGKGKDEDSENPFATSGGFSKSTMPTPGIGSIFATPETPNTPSSSSQAVSSETAAGYFSEVIASMKKLERKYAAVAKQSESRMTFLSKAQEANKALEKENMALKTEVSQ
jgi:hypothetical protein